MLDHNSKLCVNNKLATTEFPEKPVNKYGSAVVLSVAEEEVS